MRGVKRGYICLVQRKNCSFITKTSVFSSNNLGYGRKILVEYSFITEILCVCEQSLGYNRKNWYTWEIHPRRFVPYLPLQTLQPASKGSAFWYSKIILQRPLFQGLSINALLIPCRDPTCTVSAPYPLRIKFDRRVLYTEGVRSRYGGEWGVWWSRYGDGVGKHDIRWCRKDDNPDGLTNQNKVLSKLLLFNTFL